ncbi:MAG: hypothetical protein M1816_001621 [Peltula sp. TS41687]|nr:MAG: hypothetical protein M1816_001621 [Peltula sp. TS41687]
MKITSVLLILTCTWSSASLAVPLFSRFLPRHHGAGSEGYRPAAHRLDSRLSSLFNPSATIGALLTGGVALGAHKHKVKKLREHYENQIREMNEESAVERTHRILMECWYHKLGAHASDEPYGKAQPVIEKTLWELCRIVKNVPTDDQAYRLGPSASPPSGPRKDAEDKKDKKRNPFAFSELKRELENRAGNFMDHLGMILGSASQHANSGPFRGSFGGVTPGLGLPAGLI